MDETSPVLVQENVRKERIIFLSNLLIEPGTIE